LCLYRSHRFLAARRWGSLSSKALSMFQTRVTAVVRRRAPGVPFGEDLTISAE
jgi:hypothetical protein